MQTVAVQPTREHSARHSWSRPIAGAVLAATLLASGCASTTGMRAPAAPWTGTVQSIREVESKAGWQSMVGGLAGAVAGAVLGSGIGAGTGKTIASVITSAMGATAGQAVGGFLGAKPAYDVTVRGADGIDRTVQLPDKPAFMPGARVEVRPDGTLAAAGN